MSRPTIQFALDVTDSTEAIRLGHLALDCGVDWLEIGKPLIEFEGIKGVGAVADSFPGTPIVLDLMIMAAPERYIRAAARLGASAVTVTALAPDATVRRTIAAGHEHEIAVTVDLFNTPDAVTAAHRYAPLGASLMVHFGVDQKLLDPDASPLQTLTEVRRTTETSVSYATYDLTESLEATVNGADVIVQGEPLLSDPDIAHSLSEFVRRTKEQQ